jgi:hypothetical protein
MITRISEMIHEWMGWCPDQGMAPFRKETLPWPEMNSNALPMKSASVKDGIIVDYGKTGMSLPFFIGAVIGTIGITAFLLLIVRVAIFSLAGILFCGLILLVAIIAVYRDLRKASLEINQDALIIRRSLHQPVVIPKDTISSVEIRHNVPPLPLWLQKVLILFVIPVSSVGVLYGEYLQFTAGEITSSSFLLHLGFNLSLIPFFLAIYYHSHIRSDYPEILVITTNMQNLAAIYEQNPEEIANQLEKSL